MLKYASFWSMLILCIKLSYTTLNCMTEDQILDHRNINCVFLCDFVIFKTDKNQHGVQNSHQNMISICAETETFSLKIKILLIQCSKIRVLSHQTPKTMKITDFGIFFHRCLLKYFYLLCAMPYQIQIWSEYQ